MKVSANLMCFGLIAVLVAGCAGNGPFIPTLPVQARTMYLEYQSKPDHKVFVVAIDPGGDFAVGYDCGKATTKEAYLSAMAQCNANREARGVLSDAHIYAINDTVVYENAIKKASASR